jgi:hypothetical protein
MKSQKSSFLLLLRQPAGGPPEPAKLQEIMKQFAAWMESVKARHEVLGTNGLAPTEGKVVRGPSLVETDGPYIESKEVIGGYVLITANSLDEATAAARACPGLAYGMAIEVRPVIGCGP